METHLQFATRFANASGCNAIKNPSRNGFSLWAVPGKPGRNVPGWTREWKRKYPGWFRVSTYNEWASSQAKLDAYEMVPEMHWHRAGLVFWVANGSTEADFQRAVEAITSVKANPEF